MLDEGAEIPGGEGTGLLDKSFELDEGAEVPELSFLSGLTKIVDDRGSDGDKRRLRCLGVQGRGLSVVGYQMTGSAAYEAQLQFLCGYVGKLQGANTHVSGLPEVLQRGRRARSTMAAARSAQEREQEAMWPLQWQIKQSQNDQLSKGEKREVKNISMVASQCVMAAGLPELKRAQYAARQSRPRSKLLIVLPGGFKLDLGVLELGKYRVLRWRVGFAGRYNSLKSSPLDIVAIVVRILREVTAAKEVLVSIKCTKTVTPSPFVFVFVFVVEVAFYVFVVF
jgi:hypothetical protein